MYFNFQSMVDNPWYVVEMWESSQGLDGEGEELFLYYRLC